MGIMNRYTALALSLGLFTVPARAQSFRVQCPATTALHPNGSTVDPAHPGLVKCQHVGGGDGFATMADGHQIYLFAFSPLSGLKDVEAGLRGTQTAGRLQRPLHGPQLLDAGRRRQQLRASPQQRRGHRARGARYLQRVPSRAKQLEGAQGSLTLATARLSLPRNRRPQVPPSRREDPRIPPYRRASTRGPKPERHHFLKERGS
jgi:hypothetical protein